MISVARAIANRLKAHQVRTCFLLSGGMTAFIVDEISKVDTIQLVNCRHEQAAGFAAEGATRILGAPQVALATSGPGATNLVTAIASCYFDSTPTIFITGQVNRNELRRNDRQRQNGFQETDIVTMVSGITKFSHQAKDKNEVINVLDRCFEIAVDGRPGPCLIDIPIDLQQELIDFTEESASELVPERKPVLELSYEETQTIDRIIRGLMSAKRPIILVGGGIRLSSSQQVLDSFLAKVRVPVVSSLQGIDIAPIAQERYIGFIGTYGNSWANKAMFGSDFVLVLGSRLDPRQTGSDISKFLKDKVIARVDIDPEEMNGRISADVSCITDLREALRYLGSTSPNIEATQWLKEILDWKAATPQYKEQVEISGINPNSFMESLVTATSDTEGYVVDVGQHQMWAAQSVRVIPIRQRFITSAGLGAMGFALPAAIGCALAQPGRWIVVTGDGCLQLSLSELQTLSHLNLPITVIVMNNNQHGMVAQFQSENLEGRYVGTREGYSSPDFTLLAERFGLESRKVWSEIELKDCRSFWGSANNSPNLVEVMISRDAKALPKMSSSLSD
jgi:acetolactate synthase-1/2/3 large subunit